MRVIVNGADQEIPDTCTLQQMLQQLELQQGRIAIEVNGEIVPRSTFTDHVLREGDAIEIVQAIGGG